MMLTIVYTIIAAFVFLLVALWARQTLRGEPTEVAVEEEDVEGLLDGLGIALAEQVFDSTDYIWLRDSIGLPHLARELAHSRKQLALRWLKNLHGLFNRLLRTPLDFCETGRGGSQKRKVFWLTLRFHFFWVYALVVVRLFGPYHRLVPALNWKRLWPKLNSRPESGRAPVL